MGMNIHKVSCAMKAQQLLTRYNTFHRHTFLNILYDFSVELPMAVGWGLVL